ncbi:MAG: HlyD family efflux transporter periplasmic adaptor subunit [Synechococcaceae cyanobacterium]|nr:HlyD family efflux transporter periplasmic adaptor subunit [Synechococcaceae cyanobacterium]
MAAGVVGYGLQQLRRPAPTAAPAQPKSSPRQQAVAALGRLEPAGDVRRLAGPMSGFGGSPRLERLLVVEGQDVRAGDVLASFDNRPALLAERRRLSVRVDNLQHRLVVEGRELARYRNLAQAGAVSVDELDRREQQYLTLQGELQEALAERQKLETDLVDTLLRAPLDGTVLRIHTRVGERPGEKGILELGANARMEALLEIYESDISRVRLGQRVTITSENGGFQGGLEGQVIRISPQVRQREVLATDPSGDADARIVEVRVRLDPESQQRVRNLAGLKVIGKLLP